MHAICGVIASSRVAGGASATSAILIFDKLVVSTNCVTVGKIVAVRKVENERKGGSNFSATRVCRANWLFQSWKAMRI